MISSKKDHPQFTSARSIQSQWYDTPVCCSDVFRLESLQLAGEDQVFAGTVEMTCSDWRPCGQVQVLFVDSWSYHVFSSAMPGALPGTVWISMDLIDIWPNGWKHWTRWFWTLSTLVFQATAEDLAEATFVHFGVQSVKQLAIQMVPGWFFARRKGNFLRADKGIWLFLGQLWLIRCCRHIRQIIGCVQCWADFLEFHGQQVSDSRFYW